MEITFDPIKSATNLVKHGLSLTLAEAIDWSEVWGFPDDREDYQELREIGYSLIEGRLYCVVLLSAATPCMSSAFVKLTAERSNAMSRKLEVYMPTEEEDAEINRGIAADPDTFVPTDEQFAKMKRRGGRPRSAAPKVAVTIRYDPDVIDAFKATGDGWQTRMNGALREWLQTHNA